MPSRLDQFNWIKMLSSNSYSGNQRSGEKSDTHLSRVSEREDSFSRNDDDNSNTNQASAKVFLARVTVLQQQQQQQQQNLTDTVERQPTDIGDIKANGHINSEVSANGIPATGHNDSDSDVPLLYVDQNDVIAIERLWLTDEEWFIAKSDQQVGRIRKSSCSILDGQIPMGLCRYLIDNQYFNLNVCFASFVAQDIGDLSITKGDIIVAIVPVNEHWMQGQVCFDSQANRWPMLALGKQVGTFPLNHCWQIDSERLRTFCYSKVQRERNQRSTKSSTSSSTLSQHIPGWSISTNQQPPINTIADNKKTLLSIAHSSSLSSGTSSLYSTDYNQANLHDVTQQQQQKHYEQPDRNASQKIDKVDKNQSMTAMPPPPPRPKQLPRQISDRQKSSSERAVSKPSSILTSKQQDKLKGWLHIVKKKTARLSTRITASLGLISLTRDEEFERHYESFKQLEKSIRMFIKNLTQFVEHFETFLVALQNTSDNLADFYRDKSYQKEINEMRKKNKALNCEHFHAFKRTVDRQVITVASQLLQKFAGPHQLVNKRSAKLLDYDTKAKEIESCRDLDKKTSLREEYSLAKDLYDRINGQLIEELPLFNQFALDIFKECILVLLESRRNLMLAYTQQTAILLDTPLMASYTASDVASTIMMSCELAPQMPQAPTPRSTINSQIQFTSKQGCSETKTVTKKDFTGSGTVSKDETQPSGSSSGGTELHGDLFRPHSAMSQFSSDFDQLALAAREISSTPLSQISETNQKVNTDGEYQQASDADHHMVGNVRFDVPDAQNCHEDGSDGSSDNKHNENIESTIKSRSASNKLRLTPDAAPDDGSNKGRKRRTKHQVYIASWPFVATGPNQLTIACNQTLKLIKGCDECGNSDWSLIKDKKGQLGYVPTSYIKRKE